MSGSSTLSLVIISVIIDFVMAYVMLWASAEILGTKKKRYRLLLGSLTATALFVVVLLLVGYGYIELASFPAILITISSIVLSVLVSFTPISTGELVRLSGLAVFFTLLAAGVSMAVNIFTGWWMIGSGWDMVTSLIIAVATVLVVAELGWGIVHKRMRESLYFVPIRIFLGEIKVEANALIDTGNQLKDPLTGARVVIVEYDLIKSMIPKEILPDFEARLNSPYELLSSFSTFPKWAARIRLIPFSSLGQDKGMLVGIRPDSVEIVDGDVGLSVTNVVLGIHPRHLSSTHDYQALLHPELLGTI